MAHFTELEMDIVADLFPAATYHGKWNEEDGEAHIDAFKLVQHYGESDFDDTLEHKFDLKVYRGVLASLLQKGMIVVDKYEIALRNNGNKWHLATAVALSELGWKSCASTDFGVKYLSANR